MPVLRGAEGLALGGGSGLVGVRRPPPADLGDGGHLHAPQQAAAAGVWFTALHIVTSQSNGISPLQLQAHLGLGNWNTAWLLLRKIRRAMAVPEASR